MPPTDIKHTILDLAVRFATEVQRVVESNVRLQVSAEFERLLEQVSGGRASPSRTKAAGNHRPATAIKRSKTNELKRIAGTKPVACRVAGCPNPGVRRFGNFCRDHNASLSSAEKKKLRAAQLR
jgi:hypothetical protein